jgi:hypothetical protein
MKTKHRLLAALSGLFLAAPSFARQVPIATKPAPVTSAAHGVIMHPEYAKIMGRMAYVWGWPVVNQMNRGAPITQAPEPGRLNGVLPIAPRGQIGMLNDYIDPRTKLRHLSESGRRLRPGLLLPRRGAGDHPGAGFRRPLLGLCPRQPSRRPSTTCPFRAPLHQTSASSDVDATTAP